MTRSVPALLNCHVLTSLECASPSRVSRKAIGYEGKWRLTSSVTFPLGEILPVKDTATGCLLLSVSLTPAALGERQLLTFGAERRACKTGFSLERKG